MPQILDRLFDDLGEKREEHLTLEPLSPTCRYRWADGYQFDENEFFWSRPTRPVYSAMLKGSTNFQPPRFLKVILQKFGKKSSIPPFCHYSGFFPP